MLTHPQWRRYTAPLWAQPHVDIAILPSVADWENYGRTAGYVGHKRILDED